MKYNSIIVGAGSAGSIVATRLSEDPNRSILLLEAGPDYSDIEELPDEVKFGYATTTDVMVSDHNWQFIGKATDTAQPMMVPRGKVTGGSSAINGQMFLRGVPEDYDAWASMGNDEWSFEKSLPYFRKLETDTDFSDDFHGTDGPIIARRFKKSEWLPAQSAFQNACIENGYPLSPDLNNPDSTGVSPVPFNNPNGIRWSTAIGYLGLSRHRLNLTIRSSCTTHKIIFDGKRAIGVEVESGGEKFRVFGDEIILSAGAIGSPHILLLSGVGPLAHLSKMGIPIVHELSGVGQNLRDHPIVFVTWKTKAHVELDGFAPRTQACLRYTADGSDLRNDMIIIMSSYATEHVNRGGARMNPLGIRMTVGLYLAIGSGDLELQSTDPSQQPYLNYNYLTEEFDRKRMRDGVHKAIELSNHPDYKALVDELVGPLESDLVSDDTLDAWLKREATTGQHISGTCKMGLVSDEMAVVDQYGRVHGLDGLRVVDASVMPDCIRANTNVTAMMIGERMSDFIKNNV